MVLQPELYRMKGHAPIRESNVLTYAQSIAKKIVSQMCDGDIDEHHPYFGKGSYLHPGEEFEWNSGLEDFQVIPVIPPPRPLP